MSVLLGWLDSTVRCLYYQHACCSMQFKCRLLTAALLPPPLCRCPTRSTPALLSCRNLCTG
jgi:hypothetical protein